METDEMNRQAIIILEQWDPFSIGGDKYKLETRGVVAELQELDDPSSLAKQIQRIYESFHAQWIPLEKCVEVSYKLLALKFEAKSII
ncbi:DUF1871 family protein [Planococcus sp. CAU13]|uniref:DUF1871 family protein n=1 Tax=Planococcus sp. CAU13 TaxID=1541197 RepID=UPI00053008D2|nr:DUF1871 family protein [Planococcus sp. CAU13]